MSVDQAQRERDPWRAVQRRTHPSATIQINHVVRTARRWRLMLVCTSLLAGCDLELNVPDAPIEAPLSKFGFGGLTVNGGQALGDRAVVVVALNYQDTTFPDRWGAERARGLIEGGTLNVRDFLFEASQGVFSVYLGGLTEVTHPQTLRCAHSWSSCETEDSDPWEQAMVEALTQIPATAIDFSEFDVNSDGKVDDDEMILVFYQALPTLGDANPNGNSGGVNRPLPGGCVPTPAGVDVCTRFIAVGDGTGFSTLTHEMLHSVGTTDLYGASGTMNLGSSMMAGTNFGPQVDRTFQLDPWHTMVLGWSRPIIRDLASNAESQTIQLRELGSSRPQSLLFFDADRGEDEFLIVERRSREGYDANIADTGVVIWSVRAQDGVLLQVPSESVNDGTDASNFVVGRPDQARGASSYWQGGDTLVPRWQDGTEARLSITIDPELDGEISVTWVEGAP